MPSNTKSKSKKRKSGNPAKAAEISTAQGWKRRVDAVKVPLPSGEVALCTRIGMKAFLEKGAIPDNLTPLVQKVIREKSYLKPEEQKEIATDPKVMMETQEMLDRALCMTVIEPSVSMPPGCAHPGCGKWLNFNDLDMHNRKGESFDHEYVDPERDPEVLYADEVDMIDKLFLFQWSVGGGTDLDSFRKGWEESVAMLAGVEDPVS
jgi:hypothetical protein